MTEEQELMQYLDDKMWRMNNLYWIKGLSETGAIKKMKFRMNAVQRDFFKNQWWRSVVLKSRQHGASTLIGIDILDNALFNPGQVCGIIDKNDTDAIKKLAKLKYAYDQLDDDEDPTTAVLGAGIKEAYRLVKSNEHVMEFSNQSQIYAGTNFRGDTLSYLHVSELGYTAYFFPPKAEELRSGTINTVHQDSKIVIESTHEGGKFGLNYEFIKLAQESPDGPDASHLDWRFYFYAWFEDPKNVTPLPPAGLVCGSEHQKYFKELAENHDIHLTDEQKNWYIKTQAVQKDAMKKEHPSTAEEALNAAIKGAIYGQLISELRRKKRIIDFEMDASYPLWTFWDVGQSDYTSIILLQFTGREYSILDFFTWHGEDYRFYVAKLEEWERAYGFIKGDFLPHDGEHKIGAKRDSWQKALQDAGRKNVRIVPRTPDLWVGIRHLRALLPRCWIHASNCSVEREIGFGSDLEVVPSLLTCLEGYHTKPTETGARIMEMPVHDNTSHTCDALRTFAEAHARGMLDGATSIERDSRRGGRRVNVITEDFKKRSTSGRRRPRVIV